MVKAGFSVNSRSMFNFFFFFFCLHYLNVMLSAVFAVQAKRGTSIVCLKLAAATKILYFRIPSFKVLSIKQPKQCN